MADILCERDISPWSFVEDDLENYHMDFGPPHYEDVVGRVLHYLEDTYQPSPEPNFIYRQIAPSVAPVAPVQGAAPMSEDEELEQGEEAFFRAPFSAEEFYRAGREVVAEMQAHGCPDPVPRYSPHPAYDVAFSCYEQIRVHRIDPSSFPTFAISEAQPVDMVDYSIFQFEWYVHCWNEGRLHPFFDYSRMQGLFANTNRRAEDVTYEDWLPFRFLEAFFPDDYDSYDFYPEFGHVYYGQYTLETDPEDGQFSPQFGPVYDELSPWVTPHANLRFDAEGGCVNRLERFDISEETSMDCPICMEKYDETEAITSQGFHHTAVKTPYCGQPIGKLCLTRVLLQCGKRYPMCRQDIVAIT